MVEKNFQTIFGNWLKANNPTKSTVYELKLEKGKSIRFDSVREHQLANLLAIKNGQGLYYKIVDSPMSCYGGSMRFSAPKPYDCQYLIGLEAYIVVLFYKPRKPKEAIFVDPEMWQTATQVYKMMGRASIKENELKEIGEMKIVK